MHPILFRIPLPGMPLKLWWALVAVAAISALYLALAMKKRERETMIAAGVFLVAAGAGAYFLRAVQFEAPNLPIYSYGVMLGLSLVVGWYLTLTLAERDGLPKETMANCYVVTALVAIIGSRVLYIVTNLDEFKQWSDVFALRNGGLVAYGGFLGGFLGSWAFLARHRIRLLPWADVAVPSLASGLLITRIGCYLFGCDFGKRLPDNAPSFLQKLGTFPHWPTGTLERGDGSPAFVRHLEMFRGTPTAEQILKANASLPVHPTQIYESLVGLSLLTLLLLERRRVKFRGQVFLTFVFGYGLLRFLLEMLRDDTERGEYGPMLAEHLLLPGILLLLAVGFCFGMALGIRNERVRLVLRVLAFVPAVVTYAKLRPPSFGQSVNVQLSTSQWIAFITALMASFFYAKLWQDARKNPTLAMSLGAVDLAQSSSKKSEDEEEDEDDEEDEADDDDPVPPKKGGKASPAGA